MSEKTNLKNAPRATATVIEFPRSRFPANQPGTVNAPNTVNQRELVSIKALTSYVAHNKRVSEDVVRATLHSEFNVDESSQLHRDDFERVIKFLVDLRAELLIN